MPRKRPTASAARQPLAFALGTPARVAALRALTASGEPLTQRDLARRAGVQHRSIQLALDDLVRLAVVARHEGGRDYLVRLNDAHRLAPAIRDLFRAEAGHFLDLRRALGDLAGAIPGAAGLVNVTLFGSVARADDSPASDCDLLVIARDAPGLSRAMDAIAAAAAALHAAHGTRVAPIGYVQADAARRWRTGAPPFNTIRSDAVTLFGKPLDEALRGPR